jgi:toxin ParE1/3/4
MNLPIVLRIEASQDVEQAQNYHEGRQEGLGQAFLDRLKDTLDAIRSTPDLYSAVWRNVRTAKMRKIQFIVYYRVNDDRIEVLAIMHGHRSARAWRGRV